MSRSTAQEGPLIRHIECLEPRFDPKYTRGPYGSLNISSGVILRGSGLKMTANGSRPIECLESPS
jgi:hypothetical protein